MDPLTKQATKSINQWVAEHDGNWAGVRRSMLESLGEVPLDCRTSAAFKQWRHTLERVYQAMRPKASDKPGPRT